MLLQIPDVLEPAALARLADLLGRSAWQDGRATAGPAAAAVKHNRQALPQDPHAAAAAAEVLALLQDHPLVQAAALPRRISTPLFSRTAPGGGYGTHVDNALMGAGERALRSDLSFTLFLTGAPAVQGGALVVEDAGGERAVAPQAGLLLLYPGTFLHRVAPVLPGAERLAAVGWIQSRVRDAGRRALLFDLHLAGLGGPQAAQHLQLARANLLRRWAEG